MSTPNGYSPAVTQLGDQIKQMQARIQQLERNQRSSYSLANSSIDGGSITINDDQGNPRQIIGSQPDGTTTIVEVGANPPGTPNAPILGPVAGGLVIGWDGLLDNAQPLSDFLWTEVHVSTVSAFTPDTTTLRRTMQAGGVVTIAGLDPSVVYYAVLVGVNRSRTSSPPSPQSAAQPLSTAQTLTPGSITPGLLSFTAGGTTVSVGGTAPVSPQANDLWFNTAAGGQLQQWNGTSWQPYQFGTQALAAGAITTPLLAAGAVTAAQILAGSITGDRMAAHTLTADLLQVGIVVAQIVDGTVVTGTTIQNSATNPRTSINPDGSITITIASGTVVFKIGPDGTIFWYDISGNLLMELTPSGTQSIYASQTAPSVTDFEPPSAPAVLLSTNSASAFGSYVSAVTQATIAGWTITVVASAAGTTAATGVTDSQGNTYALVQSNTTVAPYQQVFQAVNASALSTSDTITVAYAASNTQQKNIIALATAFVPTVTPLDFSAQATGTSTAPSVTGTPGFYGDSLIFIASWATAGGAGTVPDAWQQAISNNISGQQWTQVWYSTNIAGSGSVTASATITSAAWAGVLLGYKDATSPPLSAAPTSTAASLLASTLWAEDGTFSAKVTKVGTATSWGINYPPFPVQPGSYIASRVVIGTLNIALGAVEIGFTYWSGPNGTGTNLGNSFITPGALGFNAFHAWVIFNSLVPAGAASATFYVMERQADTAGNWFLVDGQSVPGGLAYSNSPVATTDILNNPIPQGINFVGLPQLTDVFGITDPYKGTKLANIDGQGNITGQVISGVSDLLLQGDSVVNDILPNYAQGIVARGWTPGGPWPSTPIGSTNVAILELDQVLTAGRGYRISVIPTTFIPTSAGTQYVMHLRGTTDGSTPTTSSPVLKQVVMACSNAALNHMTPVCEFVPGNLAVDTLYRLLVTANVQAGTFQYQGVLEIRIEDLGNRTDQQFGNNGQPFGTGSSGGTSVQNYTETFYPQHTYSYDQYGLKTSNGSMYQGCYSGNNYDDHSWIVWANGSRGNGLATVLNYTVQSVKLRLLNLHSWYNSGMTVSLKYGNAGVLPGTVSAISSELTNWHINEGQLLTHTIGSADWAAWKTAGRWMVLKAGSLSLDRYGYFYGGGGSTSSMPKLTVTYSH